MWRIVRRAPAAFALGLTDPAPARRRSWRPLLPLALAALLGPLAPLPGPARAETELAFYLGAQGVRDDDVAGVGPDAVPFGFAVDWEGRSLEGAPYYGLRLTRWRPDGWGLYADFTHSKAAASEATLAESGFDRLEFTDGVNVATLGVARRFEVGGRLSAYAGLGLGAAIPYVEVATPGSDDPTAGYQLGGPAAEARLGATWRIGPRWQAFAEAEGTFARIDAELDGGGRIEADIATLALNLGLSFDLGRR